MVKLSNCFLGGLHKKSRGRKDNARLAFFWSTTEILALVFTRSLKAQSTPCRH